MKRFLAILLALAMVFALCACGNNNDDAKDPDVKDDGAADPRSPLSPATALRQTLRTSTATLFSSLSYSPTL